MGKKDKKAAATRAQAAASTATPTPAAPTTTATPATAAATPAPSARRANTVTFLSPHRDAQVLEAKGQGTLAGIVKVLKCLLTLPLVPFFVTVAEEVYVDDEAAALKGLVAWMGATAVYAVYYLFIRSEPIVYHKPMTPAKGGGFMTPMTAPKTTPAAGTGFGATPAHDVGAFVTPQSTAVAKQLQMVSPMSTQGAAAPTPTTAQPPAGIATTAMNTQTTPLAFRPDGTQTTPQPTASNLTQTTPQVKPTLAAGNTQTTPAAVKDDRPTRDELDRALTEAQFLRLDLEAAQAAKRSAAADLAKAKGDIERLEKAAAERASGTNNIVATADVEELQAKLAAQEKESRRLACRLAMLKGDANDADAEEASDALKQARARLQEAEAALEAQKAEALKSRTEADAEHAKTVADLQATVDDLKKEAAAGKQAKEAADTKAEGASAAALASLEEKYNKLEAEAAKAVDELKAARLEADELTGQLRAVKAAATHADNPLAGWRRYEEELRRKHLALMARCEKDVHAAQQKLLARRTPHLSLGGLTEGELASVRAVAKAKDDMAATVGDAVAVALDSAAALSSFLTFAGLPSDVDAQRTLDTAVVPQLTAAGNAAKALPTALALAETTPPAAATPAAGPIVFPAPSVP